MYKEYELRRNISRSTIQVLPGKFATFSSVGQGTRYYSGFPTFSTSEKDVQEAIERRSDFKSGLIGLVKKENGTDDGKVGNDLNDGKVALQAELDAKAETEQTRQSETIETMIDNSIFETDYKSVTKTETKRFPAWLLIFGVFVIAVCLFLFAVTIIRRVK